MPKKMMKKTREQKMIEEEAGTFKYKADKITFIVNPVYKQSGETINEILKKLMREDAENA
jgi:hypothetical protein